MATAFLGLIRTKVAAIFLEPFGLGIFAQLSSFQNFLEQFAHLGMYGGITKYTAEFFSINDKRSIENLFGSTILFFIFTGLLIFFACSIFHQHLSFFLLNDDSLGFFIILIGLSVPILAQLQLISRILQGTLKIKEMVVFGIICSMLSAIITIILTASSGLFGTIISIPLAAIISLFFGYWYLNQVFLIKQNIHPRLSFPNKTILRKLYRFASANIVTVVLNSATLLAISTLIISKIGPQSNGFYYVALNFSNRYIGLIFFPIWRYGFPKVATIIEKKDSTSKIQNDALRLLLLAFVPLAVFLSISKTIWIPLLYSKEFIGAATLINWQMTGDLFRAIGWTANFTLLARERYKFLIALSFCFSFVRIGSFIFLLPSKGLIAAPISYAIAHGVLAISFLFGNYFYNHFLIPMRLWILIIKSGAVLIFTFIVTNSDSHDPFLIYGAPVIALVLWMASSIKISEFQSVIKLFKLH